MCEFRGGGGRGSWHQVPGNQNTLGFVWISWKSQSFKASIRCGPLSACQQNAVLLVSRLLPAYSGFWSLAPLEKKTKKTSLSELNPLWKNFMDPRMMFHILYLEEFIQSLGKKSSKLTLLLKIIYNWPFDLNLGRWGAKLFWLLQTLFMWVTHIPNLVGFHSMVKEKIAYRTVVTRENTWRFFRKVLPAYSSIQNVFVGLI